MLNGGTELNKVVCDGGDADNWTAYKLYSGDVQIVFPRKCKGVGLYGLLVSFNPG